MKPPAGSQTDIMTSADVKDYVRHGVLNLHAGLMVFMRSRQSANIFPSWSAIATPGY